MMNIDWNKSVDVYCERTSAAFWAEPINAFSNNAFILAGFIILRQCMRQCESRGEQSHKDFWIFVLIAFIFIVGIGSFLFHTFATLWAMMLDVVPIMIFAFSYIGVAFKRVLKLSSRKTGISLGLFLLFYIAFNSIFPDEYLNQSGTYLPFFIALLGFALILTYRKDPNMKRFWIVCGLFGGALVFRIFDMAICLSFSLGIHYFWHLLNGATMYVLVRILVAVEEQDHKK